MITIIINFIIDNFIIIIAFIIFIASTVTIIDPEPLQASLTGRTRPGSSHNYVALECIPLIDCVCIFDTLSLGGIQFVDISVPRNVHPGKDDDDSDDDDSDDDDCRYHIMSCRLVSTFSLSIPTFLRIKYDFLDVSGRY